MDEKSQKQLGRWLAAGDRGVSSLTMAAIALGAGRSKHHDFDAPHDAGDFERCHALVKAVPAVRQHFARIAQVVPAFRGILAEWDSLAREYRRVSRSQESWAEGSRALGDRIRALRGDGAA